MVILDYLAPKDSCFVSRKQVRIYYKSVS